METAKGLEAQQQPASNTVVTPQRSNTAKLQQELRDATPAEGIRIKQEVLDDLTSNINAVIDMVQDEGGSPTSNKREDNNSSVCTEDFYGRDDDNNRREMSDASASSKSAKITTDDDTTQFSTVEPRGKVKFQFKLTGETTDDELSKTKKTYIRNEITRLEKELDKTWTPDQSILDTTHHAKLIRDHLKTQATTTHQARQNQATEHNNRLVQNTLSAIDVLTQQEPGVTITQEEQNLINENKLVYSFQLHLRTASNISDISLVHTFFEKNTTHDKNSQFLAWNAEETQSQP